MNVEITYEPEDWLKFQNYLEKEIARRIKTPRYGFLVSIFIWSIIGAVSMSVFRMFNEFHWPTGGYVAVFFALLFALFVRDVNKIKKAFAPSENGSFIGTHRFVFSTSGIESEGAEYKGFHSWSAVKTIVRENGLIILFVDTAIAFIFPENKLDDPDVFFNTINEYHSAELV